MTARGIWRAGGMVRGGARTSAGHGGRFRVRAAALLLPLLLVAGCSGGGSGGAGGPLGLGSSTPAATTSPPAPAARLVVSPRNGTEGYSVLKPIVVTAKDGTLTSVAVRNADGKKVRGTLSADKASWTSAEPLGYDRTYSVNAEAAK